MLISARLFKGLGGILVASSMVISPVTVSENTANAENNKFDTNQKDYKINQNVANIIYNNLEKNNNNELKIIDKDNLKSELSN